MDKLDTKLDDIIPNMLGSTGSITITKGDTVPLDGAGGKDALWGQCEQICKLIEGEMTSEYDRMKPPGAAH